MKAELEAAVEEAAGTLAEAKYAVALVGAGLSAESGIPTFRGPGGLWTRVGEPSMRGYQDFLADPAAWWRMQAAQRRDPDRAEFSEAIERATPNAGHYALADLERLGVLKATITQNIDDLHRRAGSVNVAEIHGNRTKLRCVACESRWPRSDFDVGEHPPRCPGCGGLVKSDTVMFGEPIPPGVLERCFQETARSDFMLLVGTSATVYPAASFPEAVAARGGRLVEFNPNTTPLSSSCRVVVRGPAAETLPAVVRRLRLIIGE